MIGHHLDRRYIGESTVSTLASNNINYDEFKFSKNPVVDLQRKIRHGMVTDISAAQKRLAKMKKSKT